VDEVSTVVDAVVVVETSVGGVVVVGSAVVLGALVVVGLSVVEATTVVLGRLLTVVVVPRSNRAQPENRKRASSPTIAAVTPLRKISNGYRPWIGPCRRAL